ncbi:hypothetical protein ACWD8L_35255 [Streptomyces sp. NPDC005133]|uniref:hypothetical protein n=1 Tax=unclassified Streptomyces TaxID=2593676 RepID=UPI0033BD212E
MSTMRRRLGTGPTIPSPSPAGDEQPRRPGWRRGGIAAQGLERLYALFGGPATPGVDMAVRALSGDVPESRIRTLAPAFIDRLQ